MNTDQLFHDLQQLHTANIANAEKTCENAIHIGVILHQIKEQVGHGEFLPTIAAKVPSISERCCRNYMRLAEERLIEEKARGLIPDTTDIPHDGKSAIVSDLVVIPENAIPSELYEQARKDVEGMNWATLPANIEQSLTRNLSGKDLMDLYRQYGVVRAKEPKVYHAPKPQTPDDKIAAENAQALALVDAAEQQLNVIFNDLQSKTGILSTRIPPKRWKEFLRQAVAVTKAIRPLTKRKASPAEKKAETKAKAKALLQAVESCQSAITNPTPSSGPDLVTCPICHQENFSLRGLHAHVCKSNDRKRLTPEQLNAATIQSPVRA